MTEAPTHKGEYAGDLWPPGYHEATHYWVNGKWRELPLSMDQQMRLMASEIEWLRAERDMLREALATVLGTVTHGQNMTWEERIKIGRAALEGK